MYTDLSFLTKILNNTIKQKQTYGHSLWTVVPTYFISLCVCVCVCVSVCLSVPLFSADISLTTGRILIKLDENVGT